MKEHFQNKSILITGGVGTIGKELVKQLMEMEPKELIIIDNNESELFMLLERYRGKNVKGYVGDITNKEFITEKLNGMEMVFHTAALKHVILGEMSPDSIVASNIVGLQNLLDGSLKNNVERFIFTSSDKAVNPTNVMGASKLLGERLVTAVNSKKRGQRTVFCSSRFGNVIGSRGSVFPIFKEQIENGGPITLTDKRMSRFVMTIEEATRLIIKAITIAEGGEVFVSKMPVMRIEDLALVMRQRLAPAAGYSPDRVKIEEIGAKAGEKLYEELMSDEETSRSYELDDLFVVLPAFRSVYENLKYDYANKGKKVEEPYNSSLERPLDQDGILDFLLKHKLME